MAVRAALLVIAILVGCKETHVAPDAAAPLRDASAPVDGSPTIVDAYLPVTGCPGELPADDEACVRGDGWRDCGGTGAPRFACLPEGHDCAWFDGGCVPTSWIASPCAAEDLCCVDDWAFGPDAFESLERSVVFGQLERLGLERPDRDALSRVSVVVDPELAVGPSVVLSCTGETNILCPEPDRRGPPPPPMGIADRSDDTFSAWAYPPPSFGTVLIHVEVDPDDPARALACIALTSDVTTYQCPTTPPPRCADEGTLTVSEMPPPRSGLASIALRLEARFGDLVVMVELPP